MTATASTAKCSGPLNAITDVCDGCEFTGLDAATNKMVWFL